MTSSKDDALFAELGNIYDKANSIPGKAPPKKKKPKVPRTRDKMKVPRRKSPKSRNV